MKPTKLGEATYHTSFSPEDMIMIHSELDHATEQIVLKDELHLTYLITPMTGLPSIQDWLT